MAAAKRTRPEPGHFALLNKGEAQIDLLLSEAVYFSRAFVIVYKTKLNDRIEHNRLSHWLHYRLNHTHKQQQFWWINLDIIVYLQIKTCFKTYAVTIRAISSILWLSRTIKFIIYIAIDIYTASNEIRNDCK